MGARFGLARTAKRLSCSALKAIPVLVAQVALATPASAAAVVKYHHLDGRGNVRAITDQNKVVVERHDYLPFGEELCGTPPDMVICDSALDGQPRRFTGKERDAETDLDYFGARYYSAPVARFTTVDPVYTWRENLADPERWNRYVYARNNPLSSSIPTADIPSSSPLPWRQRSS